MNQNEKQQTEEHKALEAAVKEFVRAGGGVVGICAGAYNVVWLEFIEADISRADGVGMHSLEVSGPAHPIAKGVIKHTVGRTDRLWERTPIMRVNGPVFFPKNSKSMVFSYDWEHRLGAILVGEYGRGRAVAISPHPERTAGETGESKVDEPLLPCAGILKNALYWSAQREIP